jgi:XisI protein
MDHLESYDMIVEKILREYAAITYSQGEINRWVVIDANRNHFFLTIEGWDGDRRIHGFLIHVEMRDGKVWVQRDGTEDGITDELVAAGIPKNQIVLAFHPPYVRQHTEYAVG